MDPNSVAPGSTALIFDLDGTLTDSKPGILGCLRKVIDARGLNFAGPLDKFIGPPVEEWTRELLPHAGDEERAALAHDYRACYDREGWSNNAVYPGVREMLAELHAGGYSLFVCTSKHERFAVRIVETFGLASYFTAVYGDRLEYESHSKAGLLARILSERSIDRDNAWMIGDRSFDIEAAHANQLRCIAAGWGYGSAVELAEADATAPLPQDVYAVVAKGLAVPTEPR